MTEFPDYETIIDILNQACTCIICETVYGTMEEAEGCFLKHAFDGVDNND